MIEPGLLLTLNGLERVDLLYLLQRQADVVQAVQQALPAKVVEAKAYLCPMGPGDLHRFEVHRELRVFPVGGIRHQGLQLFL